MKVYVEAQSKAALIRRLAAGEEITGLNYSMFGGGGYYKLDNTLEDGTIIAIYSQMSNGNPVAKSWGTWTNGVLKAETFEARSGGKPLLKRQEKLLEQYRQTGGDAHYYDRLPVSLQEELKNIKFHETLHQAIDRWLSSNKPTGFSYSRWDAETFEAEPGWVSEGEERHTCYICGYSEEELEGIAVMMKTIGGDMCKPCATDYGYDYREMTSLRAETFEAGGWKVTCSKCGVSGHNKATCGKKSKPQYVRKTVKKEDVRKNEFLKATGAILIGVIMGRFL
tara:strand:+ start:5831 stop:6670 length:840 start_codon:yes stop_codon:yes gene_type:complete